MLHDNIDMLNAQQLAKIYALRKDSIDLQIDPFHIPIVKFEVEASDDVLI